MTSRIPITIPWMGEEEAAAARRPILSGWVTQGPEVAAFEIEFARAVGAPHAVAVCNGTAALHLALLAAGVGLDDEVITVSHSYIATANSIVHCGARPVFVDIEPATFNMNPDLVQAAVTERTRAILCVHQIGMPCDLRSLIPLARDLHLPLIEDAACAAGSEIDTGGGFEPIGRPHGDAACFSFHPRKVITTGDGGMITTRHPEWDARLRRLRSHAMSVPPRERHDADRIIFPEHDEVGYNFRMTDIQAAVGREQLRRLPEIVRLRRDLAARYAELLVDLVGPPAEPAWGRSNWQSYCVRLPDGVSQLAVMQALHDRGIASGRGIMNAHQEAAYPGGPVILPHSEEARDRCLLLPLYPTMTEADQDRVVQALREVLS